MGNDKTKKNLSFLRGLPSHSSEDILYHSFGLFQATEMVAVLAFERFVSRHNIVSFHGPNLLLAKSRFTDFRNGKLRNRQWASRFDFNIAHLAIFAWIRSRRGNSSKKQHDRLDPGPSMTG